MHPHACARAKRADQLQRQLMSCLAARRELRSQHAQQDVHLKQGEVIADANALPCREWMKSIRMTRRFALRREALRIEAQRLVPELRMTMCAERHQDQLRAALDRHAAKHVIFKHIASVDRR